MQHIDISRLGEFDYYATNLLKIKTERRQLVPFSFNVEQIRLHKIWEWQLRTTGMVRLIILKDRRIGVSTYVEGRLFHQTVTIPNTSAYIITHDKPSLKKIFDMSKLFWEKLPDRFRPMKRYDNGTVLTFENPDSKQRFTNPGLRSSIEVFSANTGTASRSGGYSIGHFSEVAFYEDAETLITSTVPSIQDLPGSVKIYESTGNGRQGFFYEQWKKAKKSLTLTRKQSNFYPVFFGWLTFPEYQKSFPSEADKQIFKDNLDEEELYLHQKFKATLEQLNWRRAKILDFDDDIDKFRQEYPADDEEAFISKGTPFFSKRKLLQLRNNCRDPMVVGEMTEFGFIPKEDGQLKVWEMPIPEEEYLLAADIGEGVQAGDFSTIIVLRLPRGGSPQIKMVAQWKGLLDAVMFAGKLAMLGKMYNEGMAVPEVGRGPGLTTLAELKNIYWNIYQWQYLDRFKHTQSIKLGWETNVSTKPIACNYVAACLTADILDIPSEDVIDELLVFIRNTSGSGEADYNCHDDLAMAFIIGVFAAGRSSQVGSLLQKMGMFQQNKEAIPPSQLKPTPSKLWTDHELWMLSDREDYVSQEDKGWLRY